uniref:ATP synthase subunit d, mitochondrial n=1 Tax=Heterorhabditis bacteriophora TaxID=37862 RepID=A0A1I7WCQ0_HETBA
MSKAAKRIAVSSLNWAKLSEKLIPEHAAELSRLKGPSGTFSAAVSQLPADIPKIDFAALKKAMPAHANVLDSLQKQYEAINIPYGDIPKQYLQEVDHWMEYNNERVKLHDLKVADGLEQAKKVEEKWAKAPPVEHFDRQHFVEYFPQHFYDLRYQNRLPDPCNIGVNDNPDIETRFKDYKVLRRADKIDSH